MVKDPEVLLKERLLKEKPKEKPKQKPVKDKKK
jgi:hypothetical protein